MGDKKTQIRSQNTLEKILKTATEQFARKGYEGARVDERIRGHAGQRDRAVRTVCSGGPGKNEVAGGAVVPRGADQVLGSRRDREGQHAREVLAIPWLTRQRLEWDPQNEQITHSEEANSLLHYEYREPWKHPYQG